MPRLRLFATAATLLLPLLGLSSGTGLAAAAETSQLAHSDHAAAALGPVQPTTVGGSSASGADCHNYFFPIREFPADTSTYKVWGQLCSRAPLGSQPVQILIHGGAYNHYYWDIGYKPGTYSYVDYATHHGFGTLNIDLLGYGNSDHPSPLTLTFSAEAYVVHQFVQYLRQGSLGAPVHTIVLNGHSMGGFAAEIEAADYQDVNGVIVSGFAHDLSAQAVVRLLSLKFWPAQLDPEFAAQDLPVGYLTSIPGVRKGLFYHPGGYDPGMPQYDENVMKDTVPTSELALVTTDSYSTLTKKINVPVMVALGRYDGLWCDETNDCTTDPEAQNEHKFYNPKAHFELYIAPRSGHAINGSYSAPAFYAKTIEFLAKNHV